MEQYEVPMTFVVDSYRAQYHSCGSHQIELNTVMELDEVQELFDRIKEIKGIKL